MEETRVSGENDRPFGGHRHTYHIMLYRVHLVMNTDWWPSSRPEYLYIPLDVNQSINQSNNQSIYIIDYNYYSTWQRWWGKQLYNNASDCPSEVYQWNWTPLLMLTLDRTLATRYITVFMLFNSGTVHRCWHWLKIWC
jgi:hypothetical protein